MPVTSVFRCGNKELAAARPEIHARIRSGDLAAAAAVFARACPFMKPEACAEEINREAAFLAAVDASRAMGPERSKYGTTPRQAVIMAALVGWRGDEPTSWFAPVHEADFFAWAQSHYAGPEEHIPVAFRGLLAQGLFFPVHPGVFDAPAYFCTYDSGFLGELPEGERTTAGGRFWDTWNEYHDRHTVGWRRAGLCVGQGSESGGNDNVGVCLGTSCSSFDGGALCTRELKFNPELVKYAPKDE